jgi:O-antigen/teichoic acid export membrane protein
MSSPDSSVKPTAVLVAGRVVGVAAGVLVPVVLARVFDPHAFGTYKQLMLLYSTLLLVVPFGLAESLFYFVPRDASAAGRHVANALLSLALSGGVALLGLGLAREPLARALANPELAAHLGVLGLLLLLGVAGSALEIVMIARGRYAAAAFAYGSSDVLRAAAFLLPALWFARLDAMLAGALAFAALRLAAAVAWCAREFQGALRPSLRLLRGQLAYALPFGAAAALEIAQANLHQYAVAHAVNAAAFAVYAVGCLQVPLVDLVTASAGNVLMVRMGACEDPEAARGLWRQTAAQLAFVLFPIVGLLLVAAPDLITLLYTDTYRASVPIFRVFCLGILLGALPTDAVLRARAQTRFLLGMNALRVALVSILIGACLQAFSLVGGALATLLAAAAGKALSLARVSRLLGTGWRGLLPWQRLAATALASGLASVVALLARGAGEGGALWSLPSAAAAYALAYLAAAWLWEAGAWRGEALARFRAALVGDTGRAS